MVTSRLLGRIAALLLAPIGGCDVVTGPCAPANRKGPANAYQRLALDLLLPQVSRLDSYPVASDQDKASRLARLAKVRAEFLPTVADACLREYAEDWVQYYEREVTGMRVGGYDTSAYDERMATQADEKRELARKLGLR